jgi:hypothetical protein
MTVERCEWCAAQEVLFRVDDYQNNTNYLCKRCAENKLKAIEDWFINLQLSLEGWLEDLKLNQRWESAKDIFDFNSQH